MTDKLWMPVPMRGFAHDPDAHAPVEWDDPNAQTIFICEKRGDSFGPTVLMFNCDRFGYVDPARGELEWEETTRLAWEVVEEHNARVEARALRIGRE